MPRSPLRRLPVRLAGPVTGLLASTATICAGAPLAWADGPAADQLSLTAAPAAVAAGSTATIQGVLAAADGSPLAGLPVALAAEPAGAATPVTVATGLTGPDGTISLAATPRVSTTYQLVFAGDAAHLAASSAPAAVGVQPGLTAAVTPAVVGAGSAAVLHGTLTPGYAGATLSVQRLVSGSWQQVTVIGTGLGGSYAWRFVRTAPGSVVLRTVLAPSAAHLGATSGTVTEQVIARTLGPGATGADVAALQQRLAGLHYGVAAVSGSYDYNTVHAVLSFQKARGLARTGVADAATRAALGTASPLAPRYGAAGLAIEINLARQLLVVSQGGRLVRVLDVSSGSGLLYTSQGLTSRAVTPVGHFAVQRMINAWHQSPLGMLYRPAFFVGGYAIHGSLSVPAYPASHGCVRVTLAAMDWLFPLLGSGVPVTVTTT